MVMESVFPVIDGLAVMTFGDSPVSSLSATQREALREQSVHAATRDGVLNKVAYYREISAYAQKGLPEVKSGLLPGLRSGCAVLSVSFMRRGTPRPLPGGTAV